MPIGIPAGSGAGEIWAFGSLAGSAFRLVVFDTDLDSKRDCFERDGYEGRRQRRFAVPLPANRANDAAIVEGELCP